MKLHHITRKLFLNSLGLTLTLNSGFGSNSMTYSEDYATPNRTAEREEHMQELALTEGQKVAQKQAEVLSYQRLCSALGEDFVNFAKKYFSTPDETVIQAKWKDIFSASVPYNETKKRNTIRKIVEVIRKSSLNSDAVQMLKGSLFDLEQQTKEVPLTRIEESTKSYFESIFQGSTVTTSWKKAGDQLGCVAEVTLSSSQVLTYFVKTHSGGLRSGHSSAAKLVNPAELLVYKVLEGLGIGPQSHFFGRDGENLYIATLDAGVQTNSDGSLTQTPFKEYEYFKTSKDPTVRDQLWGALTQLPLDIEFSAEQHLQAEQWLNSDQRSSMFVHEMTKLDVLARLMGLTDFQTNPGNYGFTQLSNGSFMVKAIDFRLVDQAIDKFQHDDKDFTAFLRGNGLYHYISADKVMCYALRHRQQHLRVLEANSIIAQELMNFEEKVTLATRHVLSSLDSVSMTDTERTRTQKDLDQYSDIIKYNFRFFREKLEQWRHVTTSEE